MCGRAVILKGGNVQEKKGEEVVKDVMRSEQGQKNRENYEGWEKDVR